MKPNRHAIVYGGVLVLSILACRSFAFQITEQAGPVSITEMTCETGAGGHVQLDLGNDAIIRLGANSALQSDGEDASSLTRGTALFDFGKQKQRLKLQQAGKQVIIECGTGFARYAECEAGQGTILLIGSLAGKVAVRVDGKSHQLRPGEMFAMDAQNKIVVSDFNLVKLTESASFLKDFQSAPPGQKMIQREVRRFASLQKRGFIRPVNSSKTDQQWADMAASSVNNQLLAIASSGSSAVSSLAGTPAANTSFIWFNPAFSSSAASTTISAGTISNFRFSAGSISTGAGVDELRIGADFTVQRINP